MLALIHIQWIVGIIRHHPWASVGYHHGEPESVENDSLGDRVTTRPRYRAPVLFLLRAG